MLKLNGSLFPGVQIVGTGAKGCEQKKNNEGWGRGESEGTPARLFNKSSFRYTDSGIPYDWSILTALVSTIDWKCDALAMRLK